MLIFSETLEDTASGLVRDKYFKSGVGREFTKEKFLKKTMSALRYIRFRPTQVRVLSRYEKKKADWAAFFRCMQVCVLHSLVKFHKEALRWL